MWKAEPKPLFSAAFPSLINHVLICVSCLLRVSFPSIPATVEAIVYEATDIHDTVECPDLSILLEENVGYGTDRPSD